MCPSVEPSKATAQNLDKQIAAFQVGGIDIGNLDFTAGGRLDFGSNVDDVVVVKIKASHSYVGFRLLRLLFDRKCSAGKIEVNYAILVGIVDDITEDRGTSSTRRCLGE